MYQSGIFPIQWILLCCNCVLIQEKFEDTKGAIRSRKSNDRQYNSEKKKNKMTNNDVQNTTQKTKITQQAGCDAALILFNRQAVMLL